jgi:hypothetical protein
MEALVDLSWRAYPGGAIMALGVLVFLRGVLTMTNAWRRPLGDQSLPHMMGFRVMVIGLAIAGVGAAWVWQLVWVLALALIIGGEEVLESSICILALRRFPRANAAHG